MVSIQLTTFHLRGGQGRIWQEAKEGRDKEFRNQGFTSLIQVQHGFEVGVAPYPCRICYTQSI